MTCNSGLKVLMIYPYPKRGGCFRQVCAAIEGIISTGGKVHYLSSKPFPLKHSGRLIFHRFHLYSKHEVFFYPFFYLLSPLYLCFITARNNIKKALVFNEEFAALLFLAKAISGIKVILLIQGNMESLISSKKLGHFSACFLRLYGRLGIRLADRLLAVSSNLASLAGKYYDTDKQISCFYNAVPRKEISEARTVDLHKKYGFKEGTLIFGFVGSLIPRKNVGFLINEFTKISFPKKALLIVGGGEKMNDLMALVKTVCAEGGVVFAGEPGDYLDIVKSLDLLILPTLHDDCPRIILEALGLNTPCIASNVGGIPEILKYEELMFDPWKPGNLSDKLKRFIEDAKYRDLLRNLCAQRKKEFDKDWGEEIAKLLD